MVCSGVRNRFLQSCCDRGSALTGVEAEQIRKRRAQHGLPIDAAMFVEPLVLDRQERLGHVARQFAKAHALAVIGAAHAENLSFG